MRSLQWYKRGAAYGKVAIEDVAYLDAGMSKISHMESYEDYGSPFCVMDWERYKR